MVVKLQGHEKPVPLRSLGDGATRLFGVALVLANSRNGLVLIDEAENGIHYSVHHDFWRVVLQMAHRDNCSAPGSLDTSLSHAAGLIEIAACHA